MIVEKRYCDMCGKDITKDFRKTTYVPVLCDMGRGVKSILGYSLELCDDCRDKATVIKAKRNDLGYQYSWRDE